VEIPPSTAKLVHESLFSCDGRPVQSVVGAQWGIWVAIGDWGTLLGDLRGPDLTYRPWRIVSILKVVHE